MAPIGIGAAPDGAAGAGAALRASLVDPLCRRVRQLLDGIDHAALEAGGSAARAAPGGERLGVEVDRGLALIEGRLSRLRRLHPEFAVEEGPLLAKLRLWRRNGLERE